MVTQNYVVTVPLQYRASDSADRVLEEVRLVELGSLAVALAERALAQTSHLGLGLGRPGRSRMRLTQVMVATVVVVVVVLLLHAVHAQQELGQRVVVGRDGRRGAATERRERGRRRTGVLAVIRRRTVRRTRRGPVIAQIVQRRLDAGRVLADARRVPIVRGQTQSASVLVLWRLGLTSEHESATVAHCAIYLLRTNTNV